MVFCPEVRPLQHCRRRADGIIQKKLNDKKSIPPMPAARRDVLNPDALTMLQRIADVS